VVPGHYIGREVEVFGMVAAVGFVLQGLGALGGEHVRRAHDALEGNHELGSKRREGHGKKSPV
jgi:hypothetical protein